MKNYLNRNGRITKSRYDLGYTGFDEKELADLFGIDDKDVKKMMILI